MAQKIGKDGMSQQQRARLRTCASCEWIFKEGNECPKCGFASYGARFVYGDKAYTYQYDQKPWLDKQIAKLMETIPRRPRRNKDKGIRFLQEEYPMIGPRKVDKPLVLYGYGKLGHLAEEIFKELNIPIDGVFSNFAPLNLMDGSNRLLAICIASEPYHNIVQHPIFSGWSDIVPVWDIIEAYPEVGIHNGWFANPLSPEDRAGISAVSLGFMDKLSITHYYAFVDWRKYHDELDYVPEPRETLPSTLVDIRDRQVVGLYENVTIGGVGMKQVSVHAEGCELKMLEENMWVFRDRRPIIDVACYHSRDGLWQIEKYLMDNLPDYLWRFRMSAYMGQGAYIYGTPKERAL